MNDLEDLKKRNAEAARLGAVMHRRVDANWNLYSIGMPITDPERIGLKALIWDGSEEDLYLAEEIIKQKKKDYDNR